MKHKIRELFEDFADWFVLRFFNPYKINPGGNCPVQAEGLLPTGEWYYFRSRGARWSLVICESEAHWNQSIYLFNTMHEDFIWPDAGWISRRHACRLATKAIKRYYEKHP